MRTAVLVVGLGLTIIAGLTTLVQWTKFEGDRRLRLTTEVCAKYGWMPSDIGPYQKLKCYDPKTMILYMPPELSDYPVDHTIIGPKIVR